MTDKHEYQELAQDDETLIQLDVDDVIPPADDLTPVKVRTLDDLAKMGKYAALVMLFAEFCLLQGTANMTYMIIAGLLKLSELFEQRLKYQSIS